MRIASTLLAIAVLASGCAGGGGPPVEDELTVFAAASLAGALDRIRPAFERANPGTRLVLSTGSSATLRAQIEQGAPADVFLSADTANPGVLRDAGLVDGDVVGFATNRVVLIVPAGGAAAVRNPADLARDGIRVIAAGEDVPISRYAVLVVDRLAQSPGYPPGFAASYERNVASREENVAAVRAKVELGEGDAGFVYATDAAAGDAVVVIDLPPGARVVAPYAAAVLRDGADKSAARRFIDWLTGTDGRAILAELGFGPP